MSSAGAARAFVACAVLAVTAVLSGCGSSTPSAPQAVAVRFTRAVSGHDGARACVLLAPSTRSELQQSEQKPCHRAVEGVGLPSAGPVRGSSEFGTSAQVAFRGDTVFLARFKSGWKVMAAGCRPVPGHPYDCDLQGG